MLSDSKYRIEHSLSKYIQSLIEHAYPELQEAEIEAEWGKTKAYAIVIWTPEKPTLIRCNRRVKGWVEPALIGLLAHELAHIALGENAHNECETDVYAISRGLGPYLALERIITDKYEDHIIKRGKDRYLGYVSVRKRLTEHEKHQLDRMMRETGILPSTPIKGLVHDFMIHQREDSVHITFEGVRLREDDANELL